MYSLTLYYHYKPSHFLPPPPLSLFALTLLLSVRYSDQLGADEAQVSAPSDRGWHTTTLLQGGGNQQAHVDDATAATAPPTDKRRGRNGRGVDNGNGMWWLNKCDGNVIVVFGGLRYYKQHNSTQHNVFVVGRPFPSHPLQTIIPPIPLFTSHLTVCISLSDPL